MKLMKQLAVIMTISFLAELMEILIPLPVAASVYGLLLMLIGLVTKVIPLEKVEDGADFLIEIMPILFVPPTVGLIANVEALRQMLVPLFVISITTTILIMAVTGRVTQRLMRRGKVEGRQNSLEEVRKEPESWKVNGQQNSLEEVRKEPEPWRVNGRQNSLEEGKEPEPCIVAGGKRTREEVQGVEEVSCRDSRRNPGRDSDE
ncbi:antiholin-like protein LrgA [Lachnospiraceae bacterium]|jgi:holin-like protein|nr:CidA/LrgA family protein [Lachnospiraceae bacterium]GFI65815.1 antiholin-like protein LrgA [Lachnospiraceae bacterium]